MAATAKTTRPALLTVVMDVDEESWASVSEQSMRVLSEKMPGMSAMEDQPEEPLSLGSALKSVVLLMNAFKIMDRENETCMVAACPDGTAEFWTKDGLPLGKSVAESIKSFAQKYSTSGSARGASSLACALSKALCFTNRVMFEQKARYGVEPQARILVIQARQDDPSQYISSMNAAFAAQKKTVCIDVCDFTPRRSTILQQVAHLSGGILQHYFGISATAFTQHLLAVFLSNPEDRKTILRVPPQAPIVLEAACFCHGELKSRGFVCSVCLSVFCRDPSINKAVCPTCKTRVMVHQI